MELISNFFNSFEGKLALVQIAIPALMFFALANSVKDKKTIQKKKLKGLKFNKLK